MEDVIPEVVDILSLPQDPFAPSYNILRFENELAAFFGSSHAVLVSSGTAAIHCALASLGVGPGDEVLVPQLSVVMSSAPILYLGATPVFVDCLPDRVDLDFDDLVSKVSPRCKAILPVHLWGYSTDMERLQRFASERGIYIVEDACQAHGSLWNGRSLGTLGHLGCFSMKDGKLLATGEGGFVLTNDGRLAEACRDFRNHFFKLGDPDNSYRSLGCNYRYTELQAIVGRRRLASLPYEINRRKRIAEIIFDKLADQYWMSKYTFHSLETPNCFSPIFFAPATTRPREFAVELATRGIRNSVGTFALRPASMLNLYQIKAKTVDSSIGVNSSELLGRIIAPVITSNYSDDDAVRLAHVVRDLALAHNQTMLTGDI